MAKVPYLVLDPDVEALFATFGLTAPTTTPYNGMNLVEKSAYESAIAALYEAMNTRFDDDDDTNDPTDEQFLLLETQTQMFYWSTEGHTWS